MRTDSEEIRERVAPADPDERERTGESIRALARPRLTGSDGAAETEAELRGRFEQLGYEIRERPFQFSTWPGRFGLPLLGALLLIGAAATTWLLLTGAAAGALLATIGTVSIVAGLGLLGPRAVERLPWGRVESANWLVQRPDSRPRYLVMAHRDSKSQTISLSVRAAEAVVGTLAWLALLLMAIVALANPAWRSELLIWVFGIIAGLTALIFVFSWAGNDSPGALDNASGLAALLGLARRAREHTDVGLLITDGEELGLAGARAIAHELPAVHGIINLDGLDDEGELRVVEGFPWPRRGGTAPHLAAALLTAADALGTDARRTGLPPGILVDHLPVLAAGVPAVTVMRGTRDSLGRVHRPKDDADHLRGGGAAEIAAVVDGALAFLRMPRRPRENVLPEGLGIG